MYKVDRQWCLDLQNVTAAWSPKVKVLTFLIQWLRMIVLGYKKKDIVEGFGG